MARGKPNKEQEWVDFTQLTRTMSRQNKTINTFRKTQKFDPHKYFGGWEPVERTSIERIKLDSRLNEMMEYETSSASLCKSHSNSVISESLETPSIAEELQPSPTMSKIKKCFDFKIKPKHLQTPTHISKNLKTQLSKVKKLGTTKKNVVDIMPKALKPKNNFKTMINKELDSLHLSIESPIPRLPNKP